MAMTTRRALAPSILLGQGFGLMPFSGVLTGAQNLRLCSFRFAYGAIFTLLLATNVGFYISALIAKGRITFGNVVTFLFFFCSLVTALLFLRIARAWPGIMNGWSLIDDVMGSRYGFPVNLYKSLMITLITVTVTATLEHCFFVTFVVVNMYAQAGEDDDVIKEYFMTFFRHIFSQIPYSIVAGIVAQAVNFFCTFYWNYMDLFIMLVSMALSSRFEQIKVRINKMAESKTKYIMHWVEVREDYNQLCLLCKTLDDALGDIVILSFANNLFVILVQLLHSLEADPGAGVISRLYFVYSFGFLILRTAAVTLFAARVHSESTAPVETLIQLHADIYNDEIDRLIGQIEMDPSKLSGRGFFSVSKSLVMGIAGAIVTYELIFIQFHLH